MKMKWLMMASLTALVWLSGCRSAAEFMGFTGRPEGLSGWSHEYEATPQDVWEAFRLVVRDNGEIHNEEPDIMQLTGLYRPHDSIERDGFNLRGRVYDRSEGDQLRTRLIIHAWYARAANDRERPDIARSYCNTVYRVLLQWQGREVDRDPSVTTSSEEPVQEDEAIAFFRLTREQVMEVSREVIEAYGGVEQIDAGFIRGRKQNPLERTHQEVRLWVYDRTEQDRVRVKLSVRVRDHESRPRQDVAREYANEIHRRLRERYGDSDD